MVTAGISPIYIVMRFKCKLLLKGTCYTKIKLKKNHQLWQRWNDKLLKFQCSSSNNNVRSYKISGIFGKMLTVKCVNTRQMRIMQWGFRKIRFRVGTPGICWCWRLVKRGYEFGFEEAEVNVAKV